jgi:hypothetical protein
MVNRALVTVSGESDTDSEEALEVRIRARFCARQGLGDCQCTSAPTLSLHEPTQASKTASRLLEAPITTSNNPCATHTY